MSIKTLLQLCFVMLIGFTTLGCGGTPEPTIVEDAVQTDQEIADYEAEMDATEPIEE